MKLLLVGHACGPDLGSEPGFTWNWAQRLSAANQVWVIAYPEHRPATEAYLACHPNANLQFVWVESGHFLDPWKPGKGERSIRIHYLFWLKEAYKRAEELCHTIGIDLVHHVSWGTAGAAPPLWRLSVPTLWGPIGGGQTTPAAYLPLFGRQQWVERLRTARVKLLRFSRKLRRAAHRASVTFVTNNDTAKLLQAVGASRVELLLDCGLPPAFVPTNLPEVVPPEKSDEPFFTLLWAGRLEYRKGLELALRAVAAVPSKVSLRLLVAGHGPQGPELRALSEKLGLKDRVQFLGSVPHNEMAPLFRSSSAFVFTSLRDSFGSVVLEAMAYGLPVVTLDHQGVGTFLPSEAAIKIPLSSPEQTVKLLAKAIESLVTSPARCQRMRLAAWEFATEQTWEHRAKTMVRVYEALITRRSEAA